MQLGKFWRIFFKLLFTIIIKQRESLVPNRNPIFSNLEGVGSGNGILFKDISYWYVITTPSFSVDDITHSYPDFTGSANVRIYNSYGNQ